MLSLASAKSLTENHVDLKKIDFYNNAEMSNWSNTYSSKHLTACRRWEPKNTEELFAVMKNCTDIKRKCRPVGSALSPNAIGFPSVYGDVLWLGHFDHITVNAERGTVTVGAGVTVEDLLHELKRHGMTLENFSSIKEQQIAGWTQVAAHGTGASTSTVDDMVERVTVAAFDTLPTECGTEGASGVPSVITSARDGSLVDAAGRSVRLPVGLDGRSAFDLLRVGLGALGVVTELELRCAPLHVLEERTKSASIAELRDSLAFCRAGGAGPALEPLRDHYRRLRDHRHVRYMWLPHTDSLVQVTAHPVQGARAAAERHNADSSFGSTEQLRRLLTEVRGADKSKGKNAAGVRDLESKSFAELRGLLLNHGAGERADAGVDDNHMLDPRYVARVNAAEAAYWRSCSTGTSTDRGEPPRVGFSNDILGFDCGSEQLVLEVAFPIGRVGKCAEEGVGGGRDCVCYRDVEFALRLMDLIRVHNVPAPAPIEMRWTRGSDSLLSPAHTSMPAGVGVASEDEVFCWVGVIVYLPTAPSAAAANDPTTAAALALERAEATTAFQQYVERCVYPLLTEFGAVPHWAKIETPLMQHSRIQHHSCLQREWTEGRAEQATVVCGAEQLELLRELHLRGGMVTATATAAETETCEDAVARRVRQARYRRPGDAALVDQLRQRYPALRPRLSSPSNPNPDTPLPSQFLQLLELLDPHHLGSNELVDELLDIGAGPGAKTTNGGGDQSH